MAIDQYGLELLEVGECRSLLATKNVGRVGTSIDALPVIVPVAFTIDGDDIVFRAREDTGFFRAIVGCVVCFAVDEISSRGEFSWGVNVRGEADVVRHDDDIARLDGLGLVNQFPEMRWIRVATEVISGRRRP